MKYLGGANRSFAQPYILDGIRWVQSIYSVIILTRNNAYNSWKNYLSADYLRFFRVWNSSGIPETSLRLLVPMDLLIPRSQLSHLCFDLARRWIMRRLPTIQGLWRKRKRIGRLLQSSDLWYKEGTNAVGVLFDLVQNKHSTRSV